MGAAAVADDPPRPRYPAPAPAPPQLAAVIPRGATGARYGGFG